MFKNVDKIRTIKEQVKGVECEHVTSTTGHL